MQFLKKTISYTTQNFFKLSAFAIIPAVALAFSSSLSSVLPFFLNFANQKTLWDVYSSFSFIGGRSWTIGILSVFVVSFFICLLVSAIERHLKVGKYSFSKPFARVNDTVMSVFPIYALLVVFIELAALLLSVLIILFKLILGGAALYVSIVFALGFYVLIILVLVEFSMWMPSMMVVGYPFKDACVYSTKLVSGHGKEMFRDFALIFGVSMALSMLIAGFLGKYEYITILVNAVLYDVMICMLGSYLMITFFTITDEPRRDLSSGKKYFHTR